MKTIKYILIFAICGSLMGCGAKAQPQEWKPSRIAHAQGDGILYADTIDDLVSTMKVPEKLPLLKSKLERDDMGELVMPLSIKQRMEKMKAFIRKYELTDTFQYSSKLDIVSAQGERYEITAETDGDILLTINRQQPQKVTTQKQADAYLQQVMKEYPAFFKNYTQDKPEYSRFNDHGFAFTASWHRTQKNIIDTAIAQYTDTITYAPNDAFITQDMFRFSQKEVKQSQNYKVKTVKEAELEMRNGNYISVLDEIKDIKKLKVKGASITYINVNSTYLYPCYMFFLETTPFKGMPGFQVVYVPMLYEEDLKMYRNTNGTLL